MQLFEWIAFLNLLAPASAAWATDNVGKQLGHNKKHIQNVLLCLDCNDTVIDKAIKQQIDLIISFHPFFYPNRRKNLADNPDKKTQYRKLKRHKIAVFSMHTNYENLFLSRFLLQKIIKGKITSDNLISFGYCEQPTELATIVQKCKKLFQISHVDYWIKGNFQQKIRKIVLISGSGGHGLDAIQDVQADLLIVGDLKWNHWQKIYHRQQNTIVVGHHMEEYFIPSLSQQILASKFGKTCRLFSHYHGSIFQKG